MEDYNTYISNPPIRGRENPLQLSILPLSHCNESDGRDLSERAISPSPPSYGCALAGGAHARLAHNSKALSDHAILENSGFCGEWKFG
jgi:hypothetical protein